MEILVGGGVGHGGRLVHQIIISTLITNFIESPDSKPIDSSWLERLSEPPPLFSFAYASGPMSVISALIFLHLKHGLSYVLFCLAQIRLPSLENSRGSRVWAAIRKMGVWKFCELGSSIVEGGEHIGGIQLHWVPVGYTKARGYLSTLKTKKKTKKYLPREFHLKLSSFILSPFPKLS